MRDKSVGEEKKTAEKDPRDEGCCSISLLKYCLLLFNVLFLLSGLLVLGVGAWTYLSHGAYLGLLSVRNVTFPILAHMTAATGAVIVVASVVGCVGVWTEHKCLVAVYCLLLVVVFFLELFAGLLSYAYYYQVERDLERNLKPVLEEEYSVDPGVTDAIDVMQRELRCCGVVLFEDWSNSKWFTTASKRNKVPDSCCKTESEGCGVRDHPSNIPYTGCIHPLSRLIQSRLIVLWSLSLSLCLLQVLGLLYSACLFARLGSLEEQKRREEQRERRRRQQQQLEQQRQRKKAKNGTAAAASAKRQSTVSNGYKYHPVFSDGKEVRRSSYPNGNSHSYS